MPDYPTNPAQEEAAIANAEKDTKASSSRWLWKLLLYIPLFLLIAGPGLYVGVSKADMNWFWAIVLALSAAGSVVATIDAIWYFAVIESTLCEFLRSKPSPDAIVEWLKKHASSPVGTGDEMMAKPVLCSWLALVIAALCCLPWDPSYTIGQHLGRVSGCIFGPIFLLWPLIFLLELFVRRQSGRALRILRSTTESNCKDAMSKWEALLRAAEEERKRIDAEYWQEKEAQARGGYVDRG